MITAIFASAKDSQYGEVCLVAIDDQDIMNLFRTRYVSVFLFLLIQTVSGRAIFANMNLTQVSVSKIDSEETWIDFSGNLISQVEDNAFVLFPRLSLLNLHHNQISFLSDMAFNGTSIQILYVSRNQLTALPRFASIGDSLQQLHASNNMIDKIGKEELREVTGLRILSISSNGLTFVHSEAFSDCANTLTWLQLARNPTLTSIPIEIFAGMGQLDLLDMQGTALTSFPDFRYLPDNNNLATLWIGTGPFGDLPTNALYKLGKLNYLALNSLGLTKVPDFSQQGGSLRILRLSRTNIRDIPNTAFDNLTLRNLDLSSNRLTRLPHLQPIQSTLENLNLSQNNLSKVTWEDILQMITNCSLLNHVDFTNNHIRTFPDILQLNRSFDVINILNPSTMRCDCAMEWMIGLEDWVSTDIKGTSMPCAAPPQLVGLEWATINRTDLCHDNEAVSCNFQPRLLSTTSESNPSIVPTQGPPDETVGRDILATALGVSLGVIVLIFVIVVVVFVCHMRSSSLSENKQEGKDNDAYLDIVDGNSTYLEPASHNSKLNTPPTNPDPAGVYDEIDNLTLDPFAEGAQEKNSAGQAGVVTGGVPVYNNVITSGATKAVYQNVK